MAENNGAGPSAQAEARVAAGPAAAPEALWQLAAGAASYYDGLLDAIAAITGRELDDVAAEVDRRRGR